MLTREPPFPGDDAVSIISQHLHTDPVPPSRHNEAVPEALDRAVLALLAKRPEDRPANAAVARQLMLAALAEQPAEPAEERRANPLEGPAGGSSSASGARATSRGRTQRSPAAAPSSRSGSPASARRVRGDRHLRPRQRGPRLPGALSQDEGAPAYWPRVQAIRSYVRDATPSRSAAAPRRGRAEVAQLVPEAAEKLDVEPAMAATRRKPGSGCSIRSPACCSGPLGIVRS
jgi:hypothetical protein